MPDIEVFKPKTSPIDILNNYKFTEDEIKKLECVYTKEWDLYVKGLTQFIDQSILNKVEGIRLCVSKITTGDPDKWIDTNEVFSESKRQAFVKWLFKSHIMALRDCDRAIGNSIDHHLPILFRIYINEGRYKRLLSEDLPETAKIEDFNKLTKLIIDTLNDAIGPYFELDVVSGVTTEDRFQYIPVNVKMKTIYQESEDAYIKSFLAHLVAERNKQTGLEEFHPMYDITESREGIETGVGIIGIIWLIYEIVKGIRNKITKKEKIEYMKSDEFKKFANCTQDFAKKILDYHNYLKNNINQRMKKKYNVNFDFSKWLFQDYSVEKIISKYLTSELKTLPKGSNVLNCNLMIYQMDDIEGDDDIIDNYFNDSDSKFISELYDLSIEWFKKNAKGPLFYDPKRIIEYHGEYSTTTLCYELFEMSLIPSNSTGRESLVESRESLVDTFVDCVWQCAKLLLGFYTSIIAAVVIATIITVVCFTLKRKSDKNLVLKVTKCLDKKEIKTLNDYFENIKQDINVGLDKELTKFLNDNGISCEADFYLTDTERKNNKTEINVSSIFENIKDNKAKIVIDNQCSLHVTVGARMDINEDITDSEHDKLNNKCVKLLTKYVSTLKNKSLKLSNSTIENFEYLSDDKFTNTEEFDIYGDLNLVINYPSEIKTIIKKIINFIKADTKNSKENLEHSEELLFGFGKKKENKSEKNEDTKVQKPVKKSKEEMIKLCKDGAKIVKTAFSKNGNPKGFKMYSESEILENIKVALENNIQYVDIGRYDAWDFTNNRARDESEYTKFNNKLVDIENAIKDLMKQSNFSYDIYSDGDWDDGYYYVDFTRKPNLNHINDYM